MSAGHYTFFDVMEIARPLPAYIEVAGPHLLGTPGAGETGACRSSGANLSPFFSSAILSAMTHLHLSPHAVYAANTTVACQIVEVRAGLTVEKLRCDGLNRALTCSFYGTSRILIRGARSPRITLVCCQATTGHSLAAAWQRYYSADCPTGCRFVVFGAVKRC